MIAEFFPPVIPSFFMRAEIGYHDSERHTETTDVGGDRPSARGGTFSSSLISEGAQRHPDKFFFTYSPELVLNDPFLWFKWSKLFQPERLNRNLDQLALAYAGRAFLFL